MVGRRVRPRSPWRFYSILFSAIDVNALAICSPQAPLAAQQPAVTLAPNIIFNPAGRVFETTTEGYTGSTTLVTTIPPSGSYPGRVIVEVPTTTPPPDATTIYEGYSGTIPTTLTLSADGRSGGETVLVETPTIYAISDTATFYEGYSGTVTTTLTIYPDSRNGQETVIIETPTSLPPSGTTTIYQGYPGAAPTSFTISPENLGGEETVVIETPTGLPPSETTTVYQGYPGAAPTSFTISPDARGGVETVVIETPTNIGPPFPATTTIFTGYGGFVASTATIYPNMPNGVETVLIETPTNLAPTVTTTLYEAYPGSVASTITRSPNAAGGVETVIVETPISPTFLSSSELRAGYVTQSVIYTDTSTITANFYTTIAYATGTTSGTVNYEEQFTGAYETQAISNAAVFSTRTMFPADEQGTATLSIELVPNSEPLISYTTITAPYSGTVTSLETLYPTGGGTVGTIEFLTPGVVPAPSVTPQPASGYITTYVTGGSTFGTTTISPSNSGTPGTVAIACPTPDQSCDNLGLQYAIYDNLTPGGGENGYPNYKPEAYKTVQPLMTGQTPQVYINISSPPYVIYNATYQTDLLASEHVGFFYACRSGQYLLQVPYADDVTMLWVGNKTFGNWSRNDTDIQQFYDMVTPDTIAVFLNAGEYLPLRLSWANAGGQGTEQFNVIDPDGQTVVDSYNESPFLIHHSCDGTIMCYPPFGQEP